MSAICDMKTSSIDENIDFQSGAQTIDVASKYVVLVKTVYSILNKGNNSK